jgi:hypothetical protein
MSPVRLLGLRQSEKSREAKWFGLGGGSFCCDRKCAPVGRSIRASRALAASIALHKQALFAKFADAFMPRTNTNSAVADGCRAKIAIGRLETSDIDFNKNNQGWGGRDVSMDAGADAR